MILMQVMALAMAVVCVGCNQKDLCYDDCDLDHGASIVEIKFLWNHAEQANVEGMSTYFFPLDPDGKIWNFEIAGKVGGAVAIPCGRYALIALNNDSPGVDISSGVTPMSVTVNARYYNDGTLRPSGMIYGNVIDNVTILPELCPLQTISVMPDSLAVVYNINLTDISQPERIVSMQANLSGLAVSMNIDGKRSTDGSAIIAIPLEKKGGEMTGATTGLGTPSESPHFTLTLYAELADSKRIAKSMTFDVTDQIVGAHNPHNVFITLSGINFDDVAPDEPGEGNDVGLDVDVDGWSVITVDLISGN